MKPQDTTQQASEIWTCTGVDDEFITFDVLNEETKHVHEEKRTREGFALLFALGGNAIVMAAMLTLQGPGFRFRKIWNGQILIDGPSIDDDSYHPIDKPADVDDSKDD